MRPTVRIISGRLRGRKLETPQGMTTRPTTDKVKEAVFNIIQFELPGAAVLDLFAGSGQMGLEAISRGAASVQFVDRDRVAQEAIKKNISACEADGVCRLYGGDSFDFLSKAGRRSFDIIFLDPPYGGEILKRALGDIARFDILKEDGIMICEKAPEDDILPLPAGLALQKEYKYGKIMLWKIAKEDRPE